MPRVKPDYEGYLTKRSTWIKDWRRRYFRLIGNKLYFSQNEREDPHGMINLAECLTVKSCEEKVGKQHSFEIATPEQIYYMYADTEQLKDEWIGVIGKAIIVSSRSYAGEVDDDEDDDED